MIRQETGSIEQVRKILNEMTETLATAQRFIGDRCVVNRAFMLQRMELLERCLPDAVKQAALIVKEEKEIRDAAQKDADTQATQAREKAQATINDAARRAQETINEANKKAQEMQNEAQKAREAANKAKEAAAAEVAAMKDQGQSEYNAQRQQAQQDAEMLRQRAQQDAQIIRANAENSARAAIAKEEVYRKATVQADELMEATRGQMAQYRQQCLDYLDGTLVNTERYLVSLITDIRAQRQNLDGLR